MEKRAFHRDAWVNGLRVHYRMAGTGEPVVLLHGLPTHSHLWRLVLPKLAERALVLAPDLPGFGDSDKPEHFDSSLQKQAETIAGFVLDRALGPVSLVGHDLGAAIALLVAQRYPGLVSRLALVNPLPVSGWPPPALSDLRCPSLVQRTTIERVLALLRGLLRLQASSDHGLPDEALDVYLSRWSSPAAMGALFAIARDARPLEQETLRAVQSLPIPKLVLWGEADRLFPLREGDALARAIGAELKVASGSHLTPEEKPDEVAGRLLQFLRRPAALANGA